MANIYDLALSYRAAAIAREERVLQAYLRAYTSIYQSIEGDVERLAADIARQREAGVEVTQSTILRHDTLQSILEQVADAISRVARDLGPEIEAAQRDLIGLGRDHAEQLMFEELRPFPAGVTVSFSRFHAPAVDQMVGFLADGTPLRELLDELGPDASARVRDKLVEGIGRGRNPRRVARDVQDAFGGNYARAERVSRTEMHRAYREASRETYHENQHLLEGWVWTAARDDRTCMACLMMDGTLMDVDTIMGSHPNCRCSARPRTRSWDDLGFEGIPDTRTPLNTGREWFERQDEFTQRRLLGKSKYAAYKDGSLDLDDLVGYRDDPAWGPTRWERSLKDILGTKQAESYYMAAD